MRSRRLSAVLCCAFVVIWGVCAGAQTDAVEGRNAAPTLRGTRQLSGRTTTATVPVRTFSWDAVAQAQSNSSVATAGAASTSLILANFAGPVDENPGDPSIAVGPNHVVATVNSTLVIYDKTGRKISSTPILDFMTGGHNVANSTWDNYPVYDQISGRFYIVSAWGDATTHGGAYLAVSATSDPTGPWHTYLLDSSTQTWVDFPKLGLTQNAVVLTFDEVPTTGSTARGDCPALVIGLPALLSGSSSLSITRFNTVFGSPGECSPAFPAFNYDGGTSTYLLQLNTPTGTGNSLALAKLDTSTTPAVSTSVLSVPAYTAAISAAQLNGKTQISVGPPRVDSAVLRNGSLWCNHTVSSPDGTAAVRWYQLDPVGKTVLQSGNISGVGNAFMGALAVNSTSDADIVFTTSSAAQFASAGYAHRSAADPPNTMPVFAVYQPGAGAYGGTRWGDYFTAPVDPVNQNIWGIAEYFGTTNYGTQIVELAASASTPVPPPPAATLAISVTPTSATAKAGSSISFAVAVTTQNTTAPVALSCSGLPTGDTCAFTPAALSGSGSSTLTITTKTASAALLPGGGLWLAFGAMFGLVWLVPGIRRPTWLGIMLIVAVIALGLAGCGGAGGASSNPPPGPTPSSPQTFTVTVTAVSGTLQAATALSLTVQ